MTVALWITEKLHITATWDMDGARPREVWDDRARLLVTNRKLPAIVYIDARGMRFESWEQALAELGEPSPTRSRGRLMPTEPRRFHLQRATDVTGVSGTGRVADGVLWPDGTASLRWHGARPSTVHWDRLADAEQVHGHGGHTRIVWDDPEPVAASITAPAQPPR